MSSWDSCIAGYVLKTLNRLRGLIMYLKILAQLGAYVTFFFPLNFSYNSSPKWIHKEEDNVSVLT